MLILQSSDPAKRGRLLPFLLSLVAAGGLLAGSARESLPLKEFLDRFESSYREVRTLRAEFTQSYTGGGRKRSESGTVYFARGGRMRWEYRDPEEKIFLSDGKELLLYVPGEKRLTRSRVKSSEDARVPFRLLLSRLDLRKFFGRIEFADDALDGEPGRRVLRLFPKGPEEAEYGEVLMELSPEFEISRLVILFADRSRMEFAFRDEKRNLPLSPSLFRLTPPPGTEVVTVRPGSR